MKNMTIFLFAVTLLSILNGCGPINDNLGDENQQFLELKSGKQKVAMINRVVECIREFNNTNHEPPKSIYDLISKFGKEHNFMSPISGQKEHIDLSQYSLRFINRTSRELVYKLETPEGKTEDIAVQLE